MSNSTVTKTSSVAKRTHSKGYIAMFIGSILLFGGLGNLIFEVVGSPLMSQISVMIGIIIFGVGATPNMDFQRSSSTETKGSNRVVAIEVLPAHEHSYSPPLPIDDMPNHGRPPAPFMLQICSGCKTAVVYPYDNFLLSNEEDQIWLRSELAQRGIRLVEK